MAIGSTHLTSVISQRRINCGAYCQGEEAVGRVNCEGKGKFWQRVRILVVQYLDRSSKSGATNKEILKFFAGRTWIWIFQVDLQFFRLTLFVSLISVHLPQSNLTFQVNFLDSTYCLVAFLIISITAVLIQDTWITAKTTQAI